MNLEDDFLLINAIDQMGFQLTMGQLQVEWEQPFNNFKDYKNWLVRIDGYLD